MSDRLKQLGFDAPTIIFDIGTSTVKAGNSNQDKPSEEGILVVRPRFQGVMVGMGQKDSYVGKEAQEILAKRSYYNYKFPMEHGEVTNWDDWEKILHHSFYNVCRLAPEESPFLLAESMIPKANREKACQIAFETFNVPLLCMAKHSVLSLLSTGRTSGIVLDVGHQRTVASTVWEGQAVEQTRKECWVGDGSLNRLLNEATDKAVKSSIRTSWVINMSSRVGLATIHPDARSDVLPSENTGNLWNLKPENYVSLQPSSADSADVKASEELFRLPDGQVIYQTAEQKRKLGDWLFHPEGLVPQPNAYYPWKPTGVQGIHQTLADCLLSCDATLMKQMKSNIVVCGGTSLYENFMTRLQNELKTLKSLNSSETKDGSSLSVDQLTMTRAANPRYSAWLGGVLVSKISTFPDMCLRLREDYDEYGPSLVHRFFP